MEVGLKSGVCPKCGQEEVYFMDSDIFKVLAHKTPTFGAYSSKHQPRVDNFACGNCGYTEFYVTQDHLEKVKKDWRKISRK